MKISSLLILFLFTLSCGQPSAADFKRVVRIVDGDTFVMEDGTEKGMKVRLIGVDAPETRNTAKKKKHPFGKRSKEFLRDFLLNKKVRLGFDVAKTDRYGRTLAYVYLEDGSFVNAEMIKRGYAMVMTVPPNVKFADVFVDLQQEAREQGRGLWGE